MTSQANELTRDSARTWGIGPSITWTFPNEAGPRARVRQAKANARAALAGFGYSLVFPALGVEAVRRVPIENRGTALSVYTVFADVSFFLVGPVAGAVIGAFGYSSVFLFALASVLAALGTVMVLGSIRRD